MGKANQLKVKSCLFAWHSFINFELYKLLTEVSSRTTHQLAPSITIARSNTSDARSQHP